MKIPEGWSKPIFGELMGFQNGVNTNAEHYGSGTKFVNVMDVFGNAFLTCEAIKGSVSVTEKQNVNYSIEHGDVLFNRTSETFDEIALTSVYLDDAHAIFGGFVIRGRPIGNDLYPEFCKYCFLSDLVRRESIRRGQGAIRANIGQKDLAKIPILIPPLPEQKKIAEILSTWDRAIEVSEKLLENAAIQKRALMQQLLTGKRRFPEFEGQEWREVKLGDVCTPKQWPTIGKKELSDNGYPVYGANGFIGFYNQYNHEYPTTVVTCRGATCGTVKRTPKQVYITGNAMSLDDIDQIRVHDEFLFILLQMRGFADIISGSAQPQIIGKDIRKVTIKLPSINEQRMISSIVVSSNSEIETLRIEVSKLQFEKKALMQQLLTGKRRVNI